MSKIITQTQSKCYLDKYEEQEEIPIPDSKIIHLELKSKKSVKWTEDTVDNEYMNKRKSNSKISIKI